MPGGGVIKFALQVISGGIINELADNFGRLPSKLYISRTQREWLGCPMLKQYSSVASYFNADYTGLISAANAGPTINFEGVIGSPANPAECRRIGY